MHACLPACRPACLPASQTPSPTAPTLGCLQERLTLKHRNTSRWARRLIKRGQTLMDDGSRMAVAEQLRLGEELRQRVNRMKPSGRGSDSGGSTSASDDDDGSGGEGFAGPGAGRGMSAQVKAAALEMLEGVHGSLGAGGERGGQGLGGWRCCVLPPAAPCCPLLVNTC